MAPYDAILVPTDGSDPARRAVRHAVRLAAACGATVHVLYVVESRGPVGEWDVVVEAAEAAGERAVDDAAAVAEDRDVTVRKHVRRGAPSEEILAAAADYGVDVVVMGTHGRSGLERLGHAGSVAERVVREATVPVVTTPEPS